MTTIKIPLTQFTPPNGDTSEVFADVNSKYEGKAELIESLGCRLTCEILGTGHVSMCVEHEEGDVLMELVSNSVAPNGDTPTIALERMLETFTEEYLNGWLAMLDDNGY